MNLTPIQQTLLAVTLTVAALLPIAILLWIGLDRLFVKRARR